MHSKAGVSSGRKVLSLENASVRVGDGLVFPSTNWTWRAGEQWAILGPDGAGKSLLIEVLLGRMPLAEGEYQGPGDEDVSSGVIGHVSPLTQRQIAVQESSFYQSRWHSGVEEGYRTVAEFLSQDCVEERNPYEVGSNRIHADVFLRRREQFVRWLKIKPVWDRKLVYLSNGEMRRTLLVHALLKAPCLLILEDPFAGLDVASRKVLHAVVDRVMRAGTPVLIATNRAEEIPSGTTHLLIVSEHKILAQGPKAQVLPEWKKRFESASTRPHAQQSRGGGVVPGRPGAPLVEFENVTVSDGSKRILRDVTWSLRQGECWALSGPNGAGKTTFLNLIQGDHPQAYAQNIRLFGRKTDSTQTIWQMRQKLGWMSPELHQHYPGDWSLLEVVCSGFFNTVGLHSPVSASRRRIANRWLLDLGLGDRVDEPFGEHTFGQQRLVLLARAAVKSPRLLILDEPCQGLDASQRMTLLAVVDRIVTQSRTSLIFVTHYAEEIPRCVTHMLRLRGGRVCESGQVLMDKRQVASRVSPAF